ncbi:MAG: hypothetical protein MUF83_09790 [Acidimicrobiales bacterium]|nr:hypothetical protein [Acidimicrobiales bacterium]
MALGAGPAVATALLWRWRQVFLAVGAALVAAALVVRWEQLTTSPDAASPAVWIVAGVVVAGLAAVGTAALDLTAGPPTGTLLAAGAAGAAYVAVPDTETAMVVAAALAPTVAADVAAWARSRRLGAEHVPVRWYGIGPACWMPLAAVAVTAGASPSPARLGASAGLIGAAGVAVALGARRLPAGPGRMAGAAPGASAPTGGEATMPPGGPSGSARSMASVRAALGATALAAGAVVVARLAGVRSGPVQAGVATCCWFVTVTAVTARLTPPARRRPGDPGRPHRSG